MVFLDKIKTYTNKINFDEYYKSIWFWIILFVPFLTPENFLLTSVIINLIRVYRIISCMFIIFLVLKDKLYTKSFILFIIFNLIISFSTLIHYPDGDIVSQFYQTLSTFGFVSLFYLGLSKNPKVFLKSIIIYGFIMVLLTILTMFIYYRPGKYNGGMRNTSEIAYGERRYSGNWYLLGYDNSSFFIIFSILIISVIYDMITVGKISKRSFVMYLLVTSAFLYVWSTTSLVCFIIGLIFLLLYKNKLMRFITYRTAVSIAVLFFVFIVVLRFQNYFAFIIKDVLHKSMTLTGRTVIWDKAIACIKEAPILGYGLEEYTVTMTKLNGINHCHNIILEILYEGGLVALFFYGLSIYNYGKNILKNKNNHVAIIISSALLLYWLSSSIDFYNKHYFPIALLVMADKIDLLIDLYKQASISKHSDEDKYLFPNIKGKLLQGEKK